MVFHGDEYHLFAAAMTNGCLLKRWGSNSRVEHAVSADPLGPFVFRDVAVNVQAHNPAPLRLADGRWVIYHIGQGKNGTNGGRTCHSRPCCLPDALHLHLTRLGSLAKPISTPMRASTAGSREQPYRMERTDGKMTKQLMASTCRNQRNTRRL